MSSATLDCKRLAKGLQKYQMSRLLRVNFAVQFRTAIGAVGGTRTLTLVTEQRPQRCASTNSATTAKHEAGEPIEQRFRLAKRKRPKQDKSLSDAKFRQGLLEPDPRQGLWLDR